MERKNKILPTLSAAKAKSRMTRDRLKIEEMILNNTTNRKTHQDYRGQQEYSQLRATNFLSRIDTIDSPHIVFTIADQIKEALQPGSSKENRRQDEQRPQGSSPTPKNLVRTTKSTIHLKGSDVRAQKAGSEERESAMELAKWLDQKLDQLRIKENVTFLDILDYKQTVLNFALGRIIDSLAKRCKEEAQILSLVWQGTFQMFSGVFTLLAGAKRAAENEKIAETQQLQRIFQANLSFLREQSQSLQNQNKEIFEKMKNVILWNKRLRRERKSLHTANRILEYRNSTYSQALEQTVEMVLQASPDLMILQTAKKIITKLAKEKTRRRRNFRKEVEVEVQEGTREVVFRWLRKNSYLDEEKLELFREQCFTKEDGFLFSELDDLNEMKKVDIYDFFKLYDVGVQATPLVASLAVQLDRPALKNAQIMTKNISTADYSCQTLPQRSDSSQFQTAPRVAKKHVQIIAKQSGSSRKRLQSKGSKQNKEKNIGTSIAQKQRESLNRENQFSSAAFPREGKKRSVMDHFLKDKFSFDRVNENSYVRELPEDSRSQNRFVQISASMLKIEEEGQSYRGENNSFSELMEDQLRTKAYGTTKKIITNNQQICERSEEDAFPSVSSKMITYSHLGSVQRRSNQKRSMAYIRSDIMSRPLARLQHKKFHEAYQEQKEYFESNKQEFVDQLVRRRSFFSRRRVEFATFKEAEEVSERLRDLMRGTRYGKNFRKGQMERNEPLLALVDKWIKRGPASSNMAKSKALNTSKGVFELITASLDGTIRIPPKNKMFVSNSLSSLSKYFSDLVADYLRQIKRQKEDIPNEYQKALYPLSLLFMDRMTFKYGLKEIAEKKIRHFIQKVITFASISQKVSLYSLLLGLEDKSVGTDELLVYLKCLVYFQEKKPGRDTSTQSNLANIELVREHLRSLLEYFFDSEYINLIELRLQIYFQQSTPFTTVEGIALIIIRQLLKRKKQLRLRYSGLHALCMRGDNFFINLFKLLKIAQNYRGFITAAGRQLKEPVKQKETIDKLKDMRGRADKRQQRSDQLPKCDIAAALRELIKRSDIIDEEYGKSITQERFITAAVILNLPNSHDLQALLEFMGNQAKLISRTSPELLLAYQDPKSLESLAKKWKLVSPSQKVSPIWGFSNIFADKIEQEVMGILGKVGVIGLACEQFFFNAEFF